MHSIQVKCEKTARGVQDARRKVWPAFGGVKSDNMVPYNCTQALATATRERLRKNEVCARFDRTLHCANTLGYTVPTAQRAGYRCIVCNHLRCPVKRESGRNMATGTAKTARAIV